MYKKDAKIEPDERTVGIDFHKWRPNPQQEDGIEIRLIDCAGQRRYLLTHQFFFTEGTTSLVEHIAFDFHFLLKHNCLAVSSVELTSVE